jgi:dihydrofolate synthase/folylpolyglutamate synthase
MLSSYPQTLKYLESFIDYEKITTPAYNKNNFSLNRMRNFLSKLGNPHKRLKYIHIAGSKGKGSVAAMTSSILNVAGYKTGLYTSPHLVDFRERIQINNKIISKKEIIKFTNIIKKVLDKNDDLEKPTFFEVYTVLAFLYFEANMVDYAVMEVGMGGRLDATNVITPSAIAITTICYDHTDKLGDSLEQIAGEKAGIIKRNSMIISAPQKKEVLKVLREVAKEKSADFFMVTKKDELRANSFALPLLGSFQKVNAAIALKLIKFLEDEGVFINEKDIKNGFENTVWPGRMQIAYENPHVLLDGAHNPYALKTLIKEIKFYWPYKNIIFVFGVSSNKDVKAMLDIIKKEAYKIVLTKSKVIRSMDENLLKKLIGSSDREVCLSRNISSAIKKARDLAGNNDIICVTGSLYVVGEALENLNEQCKMIN